MKEGFWSELTKVVLAKKKNSTHILRSRGQSTVRGRKESDGKRLGEE